MRQPGYVVLWLASLATQGASTCVDCNDRELVDAIARLEVAQTPVEFDAITEAAELERIAFINRLGRLLEMSTSNDKKIRLCYLLGFYRGEGEVGQLMLNAGVRAPRGPDEFGKIPRWREFPCIEALAAIGRPAEGKLVQLVASHASADVRDAALKAMFWIKGACAADVLRKALEEADEPEAQRLREAVEKFEREYRIRR